MWKSLSNKWFPGINDECCDEVGDKGTIGIKWNRQINCPKSLFDQEQPNRNQLRTCKRANALLPNTHSIASHRIVCTKAHPSEIFVDHNIFILSSTNRRDVKFGASQDKFEVNTTFVMSQCALLIEQPLSSVRVGIAQIGLDSIRFDSILCQVIYGICARFYLNWQSYFRSQFRSIILHTYIAIINLFCLLFFLHYFLYYFVLFCFVLVWGLLNFSYCHKSFQLFSQSILRRFIFHDTAMSLLIVFEHGIHFIFGR